MDNIIMNQSRETTLILGPTQSGKSSHLIPNIVQCCINNGESVIVFTNRKNISLGIWYFIQQQRKKHEVLNFRKAGYNGSFLKAIIEMQDGNRKEAETSLYNCCYEILKNKYLATIFDFEEYMNGASIKACIKYIAEIIKAGKRATTLIFDDFEEYQDEIKDLIKFSYDINVRIFLLTRTVNSLNKDFIRLMENYSTGVILKDKNTANYKFVTKLFGNKEIKDNAWNYITIDNSRVLDIFAENVIPYIKKAKASKRKTDNDIIKSIELNRFSTAQKIKAEMTNV